MSRRARHRSVRSEDSVDLLLDTICNIFGLVIFVAVLAAVIAGARADQQVAQARSTSTAEETPRDLDALRGAIDQEASRVDERLDQQRVLLESQLRDAQDELERRRRLVVTMPGGDADTLDVSVLFASNRRLQDDLDRARGLRDITMRTPRRHELVGRLPVQVVLNRDRFMLLNDWSAWHALSDPVGERCAFWTSWNEDVVDRRAAEPRIVIRQGCTFRTGGQDIERWVTLRSDGGMVLAETGASEAELASVLDQLDPNRHVISFKVAPDSFDTFGLARRAVVDAGFPYDVAPYPMPADLEYHDRIRMGTATGQ